MEGADIERIVRIAQAAQPLFERMGWEYATQVGLTYTPDVADLAASIANLLEHVEKGSSVSSGRWHVEWPEDDPDEGPCDRIVSLTFDLDDTPSRSAWKPRREEVVG